jgi:hypothetical protein
MARSRRSSVFGTCRLCSEDTDLSFAHVPPERAFNGTKARGFGIDDWLKDEGKLPETGGQISQRGLGAYTLCAPCNNKTGAWYAVEYVQWVVGFWESLDRMPQSQREAVIWVRNRYPLRFLKQACTMFFQPMRREASPRGTPIWCALYSINNRGSFLRTSICALHFIEVR